MCNENRVSRRAARGGRPRYIRMRRRGSSAGGFLYLHRKDAILLHRNPDGARRVRPALVAPLDSSRTEGADALVATCSTRTLWSARGLAPPRASRPTSPLLEGGHLPGTTAFCGM